MPTDQEFWNPLQIVRGAAAQIARNPENAMRVERYAKIQLRALDEMLLKLKNASAVSLEAQLEASITELKRKSAAK